MPKSFELLFGFVPSVIKSAAAGSLPCRQMGYEVPEVGDDFDATVYLFPKGGFEPSSNLLELAKL